MHLLAAKPGGFNDDEGIVDLQQTAAELVILAAQDSTLSLLARRAEQLPADYPSLRLANLLHLMKPAAFDLYADRVLEQAKVILVSLLGGRAYLPYGVEQLQAICARSGARLVLVPGDDQPDPELTEAGNVEADCAERIWRYLREGGAGNIDHLFRYLQQRFFAPQLVEPPPPRALPRTLICQPGPDGQWRQPTLDEWRQAYPQADSRPVALLLFYRSHLQDDNLRAFDGFMHSLEQAGLRVLAVAVASLKDAECKAVVDRLAAQAEVKVVLNTTSFAIGSPSALAQPAAGAPKPLFAVNAPVLQVMLAANSRDDWQQFSRGLRARDIAMNIALPEMDGRIISRAIAFKEAAGRSERCQYDAIQFELHNERAAFVAELAARWAALTGKSNAEKRIALVLANYPTRDGRIGNGVGLDTPQSTVEILRALAGAGYPVSDIPADGSALVKELLGNVTNSADSLWLRGCQQSLALADYQRHFDALPNECRQAVLERWGMPEDDPKVRQGRIMIAGIRLGETFVGIQPARGFNIDLAANYHDPDLVPPHSYLAFYFWLRHHYRVDAFIHIGKHGNLEWLPGKGVALSGQCWPDVALGPMPHLYPFIVNDPGEGAQAKRRAQAVIVDHLMPPLTRAESYGELQQLELLVDEYYQALGLDARREQYLRGEILKRLQQSHLIDELPLSEAERQNDDAVLNELDAYLCELKEAQIRDGLHCFGVCPQGDQLIDTLIALSRLPRGNGGKSGEGDKGNAEDAGILHALAEDLGITEFDPQFDPLLAEGRQPWQGPKPAPLLALDSSLWRTDGDTRERLERYARLLISQLIHSQDALAAELSTLPSTAALFDFIHNRLAQALRDSAREEIGQLLNGLAGGFVPPGASGAPSRGRLDVLPTGRNFYSVDSRSIPSPAAWALGQQSAEQLVLRHLQEHGDYPQQIGLSVWGTATMRTGGDDIAQAFALIGVRPVWATGSNRVTDFEIIPTMLLGRPRVDVTLRVSGFFRDAFPQVIALFDAAVQALAEFDEPGGNPIAARIAAERQQLLDQGLDAEQARRQSRWRVFGSKPGAYGAGLQGLIDERCWEDAADLAEAYVNWGGYAYGQQDEGSEARTAFRARLGQLDAVVQNQDNREHDLLDSDDYYQFQGGMSNAARVIGGRLPAVYHGDHSNPAAPKIRTLKEELNRVIRSRVNNPKWLAGMRRHGYKGAFEMAATVDYLFAYDATTDLIDDYQYAMVSESLLGDADNRAFLEQHNPDALREMAERLIEAIQRGLWREPGEQAEMLENLLLDCEHQLEQNR
ncbi:cobaltochelatase subunit CobN [Marinobacterium arenosum]|uniref:cobaltochelatase subunit CobN n=1 Tax=Marinobacterium arenosum TaxID=2862496 RepID=UPI001C948E05|nr:cobaltochelatase subunit CobN [Marinobacterium arenosum]MBY4676036.1 cobaltochelatase subunit CobN [Marinobacterium arenosum]